MSIDPVIQGLLDRQAITDTLLRYASTIDAKDYVRLRTLFAEDIRATFGPGTTLNGADEFLAWIQEKTKDCSWQHHFLNVYHVDIDGDRATTLTYHTSHQTLVGAPDTVKVLVARYDDTLRRTDGTWKIATKDMHVGWSEERTRVPTS